MIFPVGSRDFAISLRAAKALYKGSKNMNNQNPENRRAAALRLRVFS